MFSVAGMKPPVGEAGLVELRLAADLGVLPGLREAEDEVQVERVVLVERVDDGGDLRRLAHQVRLARAHGLVRHGRARGAQQQERSRDAQLEPNHAPFSDANGTA